ncbi:MAG: polyribonucleotide nucleotidyltransferase [Syntrophomonadaceae bacterium]|nr:polyribonucleotide nucleotidyltransferase [Syntrophomonadaceae bacterium]
MTHVFETEIAGRPLRVEIGKVAKQANGAAMLYYGETTVLVAATMSKKPREGIDFFPLTCDYEERMYAVGKIPGGFIKREGRPTEAATLTSRLIDRPLRPLFPKGYRNDVHVVATVLSIEQDNPPDVTAIIGASIALSVSDIPFAGPLAAVVVGMVDGQLIVNPTVEQEVASEMHLVVAGTRDAIMMVEASSNEVPEATMLDAIFLAHDAIREIVTFQEKIVAEIGQEKAEVPLRVTDQALEEAVRAYALDKIRATVQCTDKLQREEQTEAVINDAAAHFAEEYPEQSAEIASILSSIEKEVVRHLILDEGKRVDGRTVDEVRKITCEVGVLPRPHGSGLFTRGQTQVLSITTLGAASEEQILDGLGTVRSKRYIHHYNFPPFSVGETRPMRGPGRREIGHGALAERALYYMIPSQEEFPYTIRIVSEVLESNGSTSMGSVCGSTLSLMHAGVPIKAPVSGIAMGLIKENDRFAILSDIQGLEDALGDMDFKVAGTTKGITALQMDIKIAGVTRDILEKALEQAREGRMHIMNIMLSTISQPSSELSPYAPRMLKMNINPDRIREVIGAGGKTIHKIVDETGAKIDIEDDGSLFITATDQEAAEKAKDIIERLLEQVEVGRIYNGKVVRVMEFGAFVEIIPGVLGLSGKDGMVHISQLAETRTAKVKDVVDVGDEIVVKVTEIDSQGRVNLSRKEAMRQMQRPGNSGIVRKREVSPE